MNVYKPSEVADLLKLKMPTLRKYSIMLEERGYKIERNSQNHRYYQDKDIIMLRRIISNKKGDVTLDEVINNVVQVKKGNSYTNDIDNTDTHNDSDIKDMLHKQNELIKGLTKRLDEQQTYIDQSIKERDRALMQSMNELLDNKKQIAAEKKKGFFGKLFNKK